MDFEEVLKSRRSIRKYTDEDVSEESVRQIIEAGMLAPSAGNMQSWEFIIVRDQTTKYSLSQESLGQKHILDVPVVIVVVANTKIAEKRYGSRGRDVYCFLGTGAAIQNMLLTAASLGLGTSWVGSFKEHPVQDILNLPAEIRPVGVIALGHPAETPDIPKRRNYKEIV
ncbi:MAG: nitroreductase family protein, partial [Candidatus Sifarchaeia archaeon]